MALNQTLRPGLIQMRVLDLDKTLDFYKNILGLDEVTRTADGRVCLKTYDEFDHHSVTLRKADEAGLDSVAFKVDSSVNAIEAVDLSHFFVDDEATTPENARVIGERRSVTVGEAIAPEKATPANLEAVVRQLRGDWQ